MDRLSRWDFYFLAALLLGVTLLVVPSLELVQYQGGLDEGFYLEYAQRVAQEGPRQAFPELGKFYAESASTTRFFPHPLRIVAVFLGAAAVRVGGPYFTSLSLLSLSAFFLLLGVTFFGSKWVFGRRTAVWTTFLLGLAPLHLAMARRALSDTLISASLLICLWSFLWACRSKKSASSRWIVIAVTYAAALLVKESAFLLLPLSLLYLGGRAWARRQPFPVWPACAVSFIPVALAGLVAVWLFGSFELVWQTLSIFHSGASANPYAQRYQEGPWIRFVVDFLLISPWSMLLYVAWMGVLLTERPPAEEVWFWSLLPVLFLAFSLFLPAGKNVRLVLFLEMPIRLCVVLFLQRLWGEGGGFWRTAAQAGVVLLVAATDLNSFYRLFVFEGIYDPVSYNLLRAHHFLPS